MIGVSWPWQRLAPQRRPFLWLAILLISASGLVTGMAARALTPGLAGNVPPGSHNATPPIVGTATATDIPAVTTPRRFAILIKAPTTIAAGGTLTLTAQTVVGVFAGNTFERATNPAQGVTCKVSVTPTGGIPLPAAQISDGRGMVAFSVPIPATTPPGSYSVYVNGTWGASASASYYVRVAITAS